MDNLIFGHTFEEIQRAQSGGNLNAFVDTNKPTIRNTPTKEDYALLEKHGFEGLKKMGFYGVLDRLNGDGNG